MLLEQVKPVLFLARTEVHVAARLQTAFIQLAHPLVQGQTWTQTYTVAALETRK